MSNLGVLYLSVADSRKYKMFKRLDIEDNIGEAIHIHYDNFRFDLTINEYLELAKISRECLTAMYPIEEGGIDSALLPAEFLKEYPDLVCHVESIQIETLRITDLSCLDMYNEKYGIFCVRSLKRAKMLKRLRKKTFKIGVQQLFFNRIVQDIKQERLQTQKNGIFLLGKSNIIRYGTLEAMGFCDCFESETLVTVQRIIFKEGKEPLLPRVSLKKRLRAWRKSLVKYLRKIIKH